MLSELPKSDFFVGLPFWGYFLGAVLIFRLAPLKSTARLVLLLVCNVLMLLTLPRFDLRMLLVVLGVSGLTYACGSSLLTLAAGASDRNRKTIAAVGIISNILVLAFFKYTIIQDAVLGRTASAVGDFISLIGISYSSFKAMHFVIEAYKTTLAEISFLKFLNFITFFPAFISGPINRYNHFYSEQQPGSTASTLRADLAAGLPRVIHGLFKKTVLAAIAFPYTLQQAGHPVHELPLLQILLGLYVFAFYVLFDFSGYTDLAIGTARIMGFPLPENFDKPFLRENIQRLWAHFHMSLTSWLTDYVYWPIARKLREQELLRQYPVLISNIAIITTFLICGIWHGDTFAFALWGLYHGLGLSTVNIYQKWKRKVRNETARKYFRSRLSYCIGVVMAFNFYAFGLLMFVMKSGEMRLLLQRLR